MKNTISGGVCEEEWRVITQCCHLAGQKRSNSYSESSTLLGYEAPNTSKLHSVISGPRQSHGLYWHPILVLSCVTCHFTLQRQIFITFVLTCKFSETLCNPSYHINGAVQFIRKGKSEKNHNTHTLTDRHQPTACQNKLGWSVKDPYFSLNTF